MTLSATPPAPRRRGRFVAWAVVPVALLAGHVSMMLSAVYRATGDGGHVVVPDYYQQAVKWDQTQQQRRDSRALGWKLAVTPGRADAGGARNVMFSLTDHDGRPVAADRLVVRYFAHARGRVHEQVELGAIAPGAFAGTLAMPAAGLWQFDAEAVAGAKTFVDTQQRYVD